VVGDHGLCRGYHLDLRRKLGLEFDDLARELEHDRRLFPVICCDFAVRDRFWTDKVGKGDRRYQGRFAVPASYKKYLLPNHASAIAMGLVNVAGVPIMRSISASVHRSRQRRNSGVMAFAPRPEFDSSLARASDHGEPASLFRGSPSLERSLALS
jgi:hypothetical protein